MSSEIFCHVVGAVERARRNELWVTQLSRKGIDFSVYKMLHKTKRTVDLEKQIAERS